MTLSSALRSARGFTLIELLVVIVIIGILATGAVSVYTGAQQKARDAARQSSIQTIASALEQYYIDQGAYPLSNATVGTATTTLTNALVPTYLSKLPTSPTASSTLPATKFFYCSGTKDGLVGGVYQLATMLEKGAGATTVYGQGITGMLTFGAVTANPTSSAPTGITAVVCTSTGF